MSEDLQIVVKRDGKSVDITVPVQIVYDALLGSMDFGSGMLDREELEGIHQLAEAAGFKAPCLLCSYPFLQYPPSKSCPRTEIPWGHCVRCTNLAYYTQRWRKVGNPWGNSDGAQRIWDQTLHNIRNEPHWFGCVNKEDENDSWLENFDGDA